MWFDKGGCLFCAYPKAGEKREILWRVERDQLWPASTSGVQPEAPVEGSRAEEARPRRNSSTVLVTGGGDGFGSLEKIVEAVAQELAGSNAQLVVICGRNEEVRRRLESRTWPVRMEVRGFVE